MSSPSLPRLSLRRPAHTLRYAAWVLAGWMGPSLPAKPWPKATVLIAYYHEPRMRHAEPQVRNLLRCPFVGAIVLVNDNPDLRLDPALASLDDRVVVVNQRTRHGCSHRWVVAAQFDPDYLIVIDDDLLLFAGQVEALFGALLAHPEVPHGFTGVRRCGDGQLDYVERQDVTVDYLTEAYGLTRQHLARYQDLHGRLEASIAPDERVTMPGDFVVLGRVGAGPARIHGASRLLRCPTFKQRGIAIHQSRAFWDKVRDLDHRLDAMEPGSAPRRVDGARPDAGPGTR